MIHAIPDRVIIGRAEKVKFPTLGGIVLHARIDTGAKTSSIWARSVRVTDEGLEVEFPTETGMSSVTHKFEHYTKVTVSSSMGQQQIRYKIKIAAVIKNRRILATFTLADRSTQVYPVLIGRNTLMRKFIVDVAKGSTLKTEEDQRSRELQSNLKEERI